MNADMEDKKLDRLINEGFQKFDPPHMPHNFVDRLTRNFELQTTKRRLWEEWMLKMAIIIGVAACLVLILYLTENHLLSYLSLEYIFPLYGLLIVLCVFLFDQVILKWMFAIRYQKRPS
ncbi:hypothetical protein SAMN06265379_104212 [Saccharicrinis carchari]|uniref:Uncharacterized protein n=1 Tax=Saccharicrinis carchari TaxID=1168039 RepID=A0A521D4N2_SACCC|nr:hypothetical protein [Saccharicrinis carchari]SMO66625.1 hypothetical protein SAMN06265379_104212 [Saccharicrinis carchari]